MKKLLLLAMAVALVGCASPTMKSVVGVYEVPLGQSGNKRWAFDEQGILLGQRSSGAEWTKKCSIVDGNLHIVSSASKTEVYRINRVGSITSLGLWHNGSLRPYRTGATYKKIGNRKYDPVTGHWHFIPLKGNGPSTRWW